MATTKGHFYNVERRFNTMESLRAVMESKGKKLGVDKDDLKKSLRNLKLTESGAYFWIITEKNHAYLVKDESQNYEVGKQWTDLFKKVLTISKYVFQITAMKSDKIMCEIDLHKVLRG